MFRTWLMNALDSRRRWLRAASRVLLLILALMALKALAAHAGTDTTFDDLNTLIQGWTTGSLGKALSLIALLLGIGVAAARQSFAALFAGVGVAAAASIGPNVLSTVITAVF